MRPNLSANDAEPEPEPDAKPVSDLDLSTSADHQLLDLFRQKRDAQAFAVLVQRHHGMVFGIAKRMLGCVHTAEDVVQATFLVLAKDSRKIRKRHSLASWLYGVTFRISARTARQLAKTTVSTLEDKAMVTADPLEQLNSQFEQETVFSELHRLPESLRAPLVLRYLQGQSNIQVGQELGLSESAVEGRLKRGRKQLRLRLARNGVTFGFGIGVLGLVQQQAVAHPLPELVSRTVATALSPSQASNANVDMATSQQITRMAEQEIYKMVTTKLFSVAAMTAITVGMVASGWALVGQVGDVGEPGPNGSRPDESSVVLEATETGSQTSAALSIPSATQEEVSSDDPFARKNAGPGGSASSDEKPARQNRPPTARDLMQRQRAVGDYSKQAFAQAEIEILENLQKTDSFDYFETRFQDILDEIQDEYKIQFRIDPSVKDHIGENPEELLITFKAEGLKLHNALELMLEKEELTTIIRNEVLMITHRQKADYTMVMRVYRSNDEWPIASDELMESIMSNVSTGSWDGNGGDGAITMVPDGLVVTASQEVHRQINDLIAQLESLYSDTDNQ